MKNKINWRAQRRRSKDKRTALHAREFKKRFAKKMGADYYDPQGRPIDMNRWIKLAYGNERTFSKWKRVNQTFTRDRRHWISTVWLGLNHNMWGYGRPVIFESMVFCMHDGIPQQVERNRKRMIQTIGLNGELDLQKFGEEYESNDCPIDNDQDRYTTLKDARKGHWRMVEAVRTFEKESDNGTRTDVSGLQFETALREEGSGVVSVLPEPGMRS